MSSYVRKKTPGDTDWFVHDRFGMIIHFGLYAIPSKGEWYLSSKRVPDEKYREYFDTFNPDLMDARDWAHRAKAAGMKYAVLTTKHHDGFCLFDSKYTDYKSTNTPCGRDLVREFVDAFRAEGLKVGFYYSLLDWHHPEFPIDRFHPRREDDNAAELDKGRDMKKYAQYMRDQLTELLTNYGRIDILWMDFSYIAPQKMKDWYRFDGKKGKEEWESEKLIALARELMPGIIINNRTQIPQDFETPEQHDPLGELVDPQTGEHLTWETCQTFSGSWGYNRDEISWKSPKMLLDMLIRTVAAGGNLIMNVGPTARGEFDSRACASLQAYADWMKYNALSIYGCTMAEPGISATDGVALTQSMDEKHLYVHLLDFPHKLLFLYGLNDRIKYARLLSDGTEILFKKGEEVDGSGTAFYGKHMDLVLPDALFHMLNPVIEIVLE